MILMKMNNEKITVT